MTRPVPNVSTHGCRLNAYESEAMRKLAGEAGLDDAVIINTCAVTAQAVRKATQDIRRQRRDNPSAKLVVTGCAAQIDPARFAAMAEVSHVIGNTEKLRADTWSRLAQGSASDHVQVTDIMAEVAPLAPQIDGLGTRARAYVQVQNGCDHRCTFCIIPYGRGNSRSVPAATVVEQVKRLVGRGFNEVVLTGVDMTSWGADLTGTSRLGDLVQQILAQVPDLPRLRISSIDSIEVDSALLEAIATQPRLMPHLHLSLQSGDDMILKRMKRRHLRDDAIAFCEAARALRPDITFGADLIAGFPTETDAMFDNSMRLIKDCGLTWLHVFPFSARPGTPAARMPPVDGATIKQRAAKLRAAGDAAVQELLGRQVGSTHDVHMETTRTGRTPQFAEVTLGRDQTRGSIVRAEITGFAENALFGIRA